MKERYHRQEGKLVFPYRLTKKAWLSPVGSILFLGATGASWAPYLWAEGSSRAKSASTASLNGIPQGSKSPPKVESAPSSSSASLALLGDASLNSPSARRRPSRAALSQPDPSRAPYNFYGQVHFPLQWGKYKDLGDKPGTKDRLGDLALCPALSLMFGNLYTTQDLSLSLEVRALPTWKVAQESFSDRFAWPNHYFGGQLRYGKEFVGGLGYAGCLAWGDKKGQSASSDDSRVYLPGILVSGSYAFAPEVSGFGSLLYGIPRKLDDSSSPNKSALAPHLSVGVRGAVVKGIQGCLQGFWFISNGDKTSIKLPTDYLQGFFSHPIGAEFSVVLQLFSFFQLKPFIGCQAFRGARDGRVEKAFKSTMYGGISLDLSLSEKSTNPLNFPSFKSALGFDVKAGGSVYEAYPLSPILERWAVSTTISTGNTASNQSTINLNNLYSPNALTTRLEVPLTIPDLSQGGYSDGDPLLQLRHSLNEGNGALMKVQLLSKEGSQSVALEAVPDRSCHQFAYKQGSLPPAGEYQLTVEVDTTAQGYGALSGKAFWSAPQLIVPTDWLASGGSKKAYTVKRFFPGNEAIKSNSGSDPLIKVVQDTATDRLAGALAAKAPAELGYTIPANYEWIGRAILDCSNGVGQDGVRSIAVYPDKLVDEGLEKSDWAVKGDIMLGLSESDDKTRLRVDCYAPSSALTDLQGLDWVFELNDAQAFAKGRLEAVTAAPPTHSSASISAQFLKPLTANNLQGSLVGPLALEVDDGSGKKETKLFRLTPEGRYRVLRSLLASEEKASDVNLVSLSGSESYTITELNLPKLTTGQSFTVGLLFDPSEVVTIKEDKLSGSTAPSTSKALKSYLVYAKDRDQVSNYTLSEGFVEGEKGQSLDSVSGWTPAWCSANETEAILTTALEDFDTNRKTYSGFITNKQSNQDITEKLKRNFTQLAGLIDTTSDLKGRRLDFLGLQKSSGTPLAASPPQLGRYGTLGKASAVPGSTAPIWVTLSDPASGIEDHEGAFAFLKLKKN